jgi:hypothetical protein
MRYALLLSILIAIPCLAAAEPVTLTLFDFEGGVADWHANPWSGGQGFVEPAPEARFGTGALQVRYADIPQGCNMISPYLPDDAPWRTEDYDSLSFWLKGDGTQAWLNVILATEVGDLSPTHSGRVPLDSTKWRRFSLKFGTLWNREHQPFRLSALKRIYFGATGTHQALIDHVQLQRPLRRVPLVALDHGGPAAVEPAVYANREGLYFLTFDPKSVLAPTISGDITVRWPRKKPERLTLTLPALEATAETWVQLPAVPDAAGEARLTLSFKEPNGVPCYDGRFSFPVALEALRLEPTELQLVPRPKSLLRHPTKLKLPPEMLAHVISQPLITQVALDMLTADLARTYGRLVRQEPRRPQNYKPAILILAPGYQEPILPSEVTDRLPLLRPEGYVLHAGPEEIVLAALDEAGMRYGALTLKQILRDGSPSAEEAAAPGVTILDWPTLPIRAVSLGLPTARWGYPNDAPVTVDFFLDFLQRTVVDQKINWVGLEVLQGMKFDRHPEINGPSAWTKDEVRQVVAFLRNNGVEVFPLVNSLGHANWLVIPMPQLREDGDTNTLCTRHPDVRRVLTDVYDEIIAVFEPRVFHFGLDEIRWQTLNVPEEKRCPRCAGLDKRDLFVEHVRWLHQFADSRNLRMLMWADMILPEHNGGAPFYLADTVDKLPQEIVLCDWSATLAPLSLWDLHRRGFTVWKCNSRGVNNAQLPYVAGNMWGIWSRVPWLTETGWDALGYSYLNQLVAAEYGWNVYPDLLADGVPLAEEFFGKRPLAQQRLAEPDAPNSGAEVTSLSPGDKPLKLAGLKLQPWAASVREEKAFALEKPASVLYALLAAELPADPKAFYEEFKKKEHWQGVPIGQIVLKYEDGTEAAQPILYGYHVRAAAPDEPFPQAYGALATAAWPVGEAQRMAYLVPFVNPAPDKPVAELRFVPGGLGAKPLLLGLATRDVWEADE